MLFDLPTPEAFALTILVTTTRALLESSPTILGGVLAAAYLRTQVSLERMHAAFSGDGVAGIVRAGLIGATMPVCSIGVLPVLRELRRMGLPAGKLAAVAVVAPLLNPLSALYGLSVLTLAQLAMLTVATGAAAIAAGDVSSRFLLPCRVTAGERPVASSGVTRLFNLLVASSRSVTGLTAVDLSVAIGATALVASVLPSGAYNPLCEAGNSAGPAAAALAALPQYVSPSRGIIQFAGIGNEGLSLATGLAICVFGTAISAASVLQFARWYGARRSFALLACLLLVLGAIIYGCLAIQPQPRSGVGELTLLDGMTRPAFSTFSKLPGALKRSLALVDPLAAASAALVLALFVTGLVFRLLRTGYRNDTHAAPVESNRGRMSRAIPASQLGAVAAVGIGLLLFACSYAVFPPSSELFEQMEAYRLNANIALYGGEASSARDQIAAWDSAAASVPIAAAIRGRFPTRSQRDATRELRERLRDALRLLNEGEIVSARKRMRELQPIQSKALRAFAGGSS